MNQHLRFTDAVRLEMPPEVAAAAAARSQLVPDPAAIANAWSNLPGGLQDRIGSLAVSVVFNSWLWMDESQEPAERWLTDTATQAADAQADEDFDELHRLISSSVPTLFGCGGQDPGWSTGASPVALSPIAAGIGLHRQAWAALQARAGFLKAAAWSDREAVSWPEDDAETEAFADLFLVACHSQSEARALAAHLAWREAVQVQHPRRSEVPPRVLAEVALRRADLALILGEAVSGAASSLPAGELVARLEAHRAAWTAHREAPDSEGVWAAQEAADAVLVALCANRAEAEALVQHAQWYGAELAAAGDDKRDCLTLDGKQLAARAEELALVTADSAVRLAA